MRSAPPPRRRAAARRSSTRCASASRRRHAKSGAMMRSGTARKRGSFRTWRRRRRGCELLACPVAVAMHRAARVAPRRRHRAAAGRTRRQGAAQPAAAGRVVRPPPQPCAAARCEQRWWRRGARAEGAAGVRLRTARKRAGASCRLRVNHQYRARCRHFFFPATRSDSRSISEPHSRSLRAGPLCSARQQYGRLFKVRRASVGLLRCGGALHLRVCRCSTRLVKGAARDCEAPAPRCCSARLFSFPWRARPLCCALRCVGAGPRARRAQGAGRSVCCAARWPQAAHLGAAVATLPPAGAT